MGRRNAETLGDIVTETVQRAIFGAVRRAGFPPIFIRTWANGPVKDRRVGGMT